MLLLFVLVFGLCQNVCFKCFFELCAYLIVDAGSFALSAKFAKDSLKFQVFKSVYQLVQFFLMLTWWLYFCKYLDWCPRIFFDLFQDQQHSFIFITVRWCIRQFWAVWFCMFEVSLRFVFLMEQNLICRHLQYN